MLAGPLRVHFCVFWPAGLEPTAGRAAPGTLFPLLAGGPGAYVRAAVAGGWWVGGWVGGWCCKTMNRFLKVAEKELPV